MNDELMKGIEAEYLYQCRRSFETQDCGISANLLDRIKTELSEKDTRIAELEAALDVAANYLERVYTSDIWEADYKRYAEAARAAYLRKKV